MNLLAEIGFWVRRRAAKCNEYTLNWNELSFENVGEWPVVLKCLSAAVLMFLLVGFVYWLMIQPNTKEYDLLVQHEKALRKQFETQQRQASHLHAYRQQLFTMQHRLRTMLRQLSQRSEMPGLLEDISKTGISSGLTFELFAPQSEVVHDFYMELPINLVVVGNYHQFAVFISRIAQMNLIVTWHDFEIRPYAVESQPRDVREEDNLPDYQSELLTMTMAIKVYWAREGANTQKLTVSPSKESLA